ncbi:MAG: hypothetical protein FWH57_02615 [Oscillospiraceae bacterium]|nr:hypothetical protein [Oscillospiraceae bacterium]
MLKSLYRCFLIIKRCFAESGKLAKWLLHFLLYYKKIKSIENGGKKVIVVGNGPSVSDFDFFMFSRLGYEFLCVNYFALDERFFKIRPKFYCIVDPAVYKKCQDVNDKANELFHILENVDWEMTLVCTAYQRPVINNKLIRVDKINNHVYNGTIKWLQKSVYNKNIGTFGYQNVICAALYYLLSSNVLEIGLIGVENDWHRELYVDENNDVIREYRHFYGTQRINITLDEQIQRGELYKYFYWYYITLYQYSIAASYAKMKSILVYNYCKYSYIDVFDKKQLVRNNDVDS